MKLFKKKLTKEQRQKARNMIIGSLAILTAWIIALWNRILDIIGVDIGSLLTSLVVATTAFYIYCTCLSM